MKRLLTAFVSILALGQVAMDKDVTKILLVGHKLDHQFGAHMHFHEGKLLAKSLNQNPGVKATVSNG